MSRTLRYLITFSLLSTLAVPSAVSAWESRGCPPEYWANNTTWWHGYRPEESIGSVFSSAPPPYAGMTLLAGLSLAGGDDLAGAQETLLRSAITMVLNEQPDGVPQRIARTNEALASGDQVRILRLAARLDTFNVGGECVLHGASPTPTPRGDQLGGTGTPRPRASAPLALPATPAAALLPDTSGAAPPALSGVVLGFALLLLGALGAIAREAVTQRRRR